MALRTVIIPVLEPDDRFAALVQSVRESDPSGQTRVIVVNDGSSPACGPVFEAAGAWAVILRHESNQGKGAALKTAFRYLLEQNLCEGTIALMDGDGQHRIEDVRHLLEEAGKGGSGIYLGSRRFTGKVPLRSRLGNTITRKVFGLVMGQEIYDTQTGLRAFPAGLLRWMLLVPGERYEYEICMLMRAVEEQIPVFEVPVRTVYENNNAGSHFRTVRDSWRIYRRIFSRPARFLGNSLLSFLADYLAYAALIILGLSLVWANVLARIGSGGINYFINRNFVFGAGGGGKSLSRYICLAACILLADTLLLRGLVSGLGIPPLAAKLIVEPVLFLVSWTVQRRKIFRHVRGGQSYA